MFIPFDLKSLGALDDGRIAELFTQKLKQVHDDCKDRPALGKARKLVLTVTLVPEADERGEHMTHCDVQIDCKVAMPKNASRVYTMKSVPGGLLFNEENPEDVRQGTLGLSVGPKSTSEKKSAKAGKVANDAP